MHFQAFDNADDMQAALSSAMESADNNVDIYQESLKAGDFYVADGGDFVIYGVVLDAVAMSKSASEKRYLSELYAEDHMKNYRFSRGFSPMCLDGELGDMHVSTMMMKITAEQFEAAKEAGFPQEGDEIKALLGIED